MGNVTIYAGKHIPCVVGVAQKCNWEPIGKTIELHKIQLNDEAKRTELKNSFLEVEEIIDGNIFSLTFKGVDLSDIDRDERMVEYFKTTYRAMQTTKISSSGVEKKKDKPITVVDVIEELLEQRSGKTKRMEKRTWTNFMVLDNF